MNIAKQEKTKTGLLAIWAEVAPDFVLRYQEWHNCEHIPERVAIPGFRNGRRYRGFEDAPNFLMMYETDTLDVLASEAYLAALNAPSPRSVESLGQFITPIRATFELIAEKGKAPALLSPYLLSLRFNLPEDVDDALISAYCTDWLAALSQHKAINRVRLFESDEATASIETSERGIFSDGPQPRRYLALMEFNQPFETAGNPVDEIDASVFPAGAGRTDELENELWLEIGYDSVM